SRFDRVLFITSLATLPYLVYGSMLGIFIVLVRLIWRHRSPCLDPLTRNCLGLIALLLLMSALDAYRPGEAFLQLANFWPYMLLFAYLPGLLRQLETLENLAIALVLSSIPINLIAIGEFILKAPFFPQPWRSIPWIEAVRKAPHRGRAMAMFDHPNVMASYLVIVLGLAVGLLVMQMAYGTTHRRRIHVWSRQKGDRPQSLSDPALLPQDAQFSPGFSSSVLLPCAVGLLLVGIFCTGSRNGLAIALSQLIVFGLASRANRKILAMIAAVIGVGAIAIATVGLGTRPMGIFDFTDDPRVGIWAIAVDLIRERPWLGWGLGNFKFLYPARLIDPTYTDIFHAHNIWLLLGSEAGIPVMIAMSVFVGFMCYRVARVCLGDMHLTFGRFLKKASVVTVDGAIPDSGVPKRAIALGYLLAFWGCLGFALLDITFYDVRVNALNWTLLAALYVLPYEETR
ncbi:MAG: O-antigen ligase family protein, partial [Leptolyngbyaceae bacterium]|nr:O-antigen ligase family protein [Leptolyngbyaceae bacterium]